MFIEEEITMPPKVQFTREEIIDAAFDAARETGFSGITAREVADRLNCSVAPIYVNFSSMEELAEAVLHRVFTISDEMLAKQTGPRIFENIGRASLEFAREYPVILRELIMNPDMHQSSREAQSEALVDALREDPELGKLSRYQRRRLLAKMQIFQTGLTMMHASGSLPSWIDEREAENLLMETGNELLHAAVQNTGE